jgi:hypothetical protein
MVRLGLILLPLVLLMGVASVAPGADAAPAEDGGDFFFFEWSPGSGEVVAAGSKRVPFSLADGAKRIDFPIGGGGAWPNDKGVIAEADVKLGHIPPVGVIEFWFRCSRDVSVSPHEKVEVTLFKCADLEIVLTEDARGARVTVSAGGRIVAPRHPDRYATEFVHLRKGQWYHFTVSYNAPERNAWRSYLYDVEQPRPAWQKPFRFKHTSAHVRFEGGFTPKDPTRTKPLAVALGPFIWAGGRTTSTADIRARYKRFIKMTGWEPPPNRGEGLQDYGDQKLDLEKLGGDVLFKQSFTDLNVDNWQMEGPGRMAIDDGRLLVTNSDHVTFWLKRKLGRHFVAAWDFKPASREGLAIVFVSANGLEGKDLFDPSLAKRSGVFNQYVRGDLRSYHFSYWAGTRGSANGRKNPGLQMVAICRDRIHLDQVAGRKGPWRIAVARRGPGIDLTVDGRRLLTYTDDGKTRGSVLGEGYLGLRQMKRTGKATYDNLVIRAIEPEPRD